MARSRTLLAAAIAAAGADAGSPCNGQEEFCELPLSWYTFPGTHASNAVNLVGPAQLEEPLGESFEPTSQCYFDCHDANIQRQLDLGARLLNLELCEKAAEPGELYSCRGPPSGDPGATAFGEPLAASLETVRQWLEAHPHEVVALQGSGPQLLSAAEAKFAQAVAVAFEGTGRQCPPPPAEAEDGAGEGTALRCMEWDLQAQRNAKDITLGKLIRTGRRLLYMDIGAAGLLDSNSSSSASSSASALAEQLRGFADRLPPRAQSNNTAVAFNVYRRQALPATSPDFVRLMGDPEFEDMSPCTYMLAAETNTRLIPPDSIYPGLQALEQRCKGTCLGYRSELEVVHQVLLGRGYNLRSIVVDFVQYGDLSATGTRLNQANWRRFKDLPEPTLELWHRRWFPWVAGSFAGIAVLLLAGHGIWLHRRWRRMRQQRAEEAKAAKATLARYTMANEDTAARRQSAISKTSVEKPRATARPGRSVWKENKAGAKDDLLMRMSFAPTRADGKGRMTCAPRSPQQRMAVAEANSRLRAEMAKSPTRVTVAVDANSWKPASAAKPPRMTVADSNSWTPASSPKPPRMTVAEANRRFYGDTAPLQQPLQQLQHLQQQQRQSEEQPPAGPPTKPRVQILDPERKAERDARRVNIHVSFFGSDETDTGARPDTE